MSGGLLLSSRRAVAAACCRSSGSSLGLTAVWSGVPRKSLNAQDMQLFHSKMLTSRPLVVRMLSSAVRRLHSTSPRNSTVTTGSRSLTSAPQPLETSAASASALVQRIPSLASTHEHPHKPPGSSPGGGDGSDGNGTRRGSKNPLLGYVLIVGVSTAIVLSLVLYYDTFVANEAEDPILDAVDEIEQMMQQQQDPLDVLELELIDERQRRARGWFSYYIWTPFLTTLRFTELFLRFIPVLISFPIVFWLVKSQRDRWYRFLLWTIGKSGASLIKLGQWIATRPDLFPRELCNRLSELHSHAPAHSFAATRKLVEHAYGRPLEAVFEQFQHVPIAAGAIAQVHKAVVDGIPVAVKVRHPNVERNVIRDLRILRSVVNFATFVLPGYLKWMHLDEAVAEFSLTMRAQLDMAVEAKNLDAFNKNFAQYGQIVFPRAIAALCKPEVLVETFETGEEISHFIDRPDSAEISKKELARLGLGMYLKMMLIDNFSHNDLHPGNILVRKTLDNRPQLVILDVGLVTRLTARDWRNFLDLFKAVISGNAEQAATLMIERSRHRYATAEEEAKFKREMAEVINDVMLQDLQQVEVGRVLQRVLDVGRRNHVGIESNFSSLVLGTVVVEGLARQLNPDINFVLEAAPFLVMSPRVRRTFLRDLFSHRHVLTDQQG